MEGSRWLHATLLDQVLGLKSETRNDTWRGVSHNAPFNLFTYARVEVDWLSISLNHSRTFGTCVIWGIKDESLSLRPPIRRHVALGCVSMWPVVNLHPIHQPARLSI